VDGAIVVPAPAGFAIAAEKDADEPALPATADDLSETTGNISSESGTQPAHCGRASYCEINCLGEELGEGQSVDLLKNRRSRGRARPLSADTTSRNKFELRWNRVFPRLPG
jgi:hypothetical protein